MMPAFIANQGRLQGVTGPDSHHGSYVTNIRLIAEQGWLHVTGRPDSYRTALAWPASTAPAMTPTAVPCLTHIDPCGAVAMYPYARGGARAWC